MKEASMPQEFNHPSRLIDREELRVLLGVKSKTTMARILANKKDPIPCVHIPGTHPKYPLDKILWYIEKHLA